MLNPGPHHNARYAKLRRKVGKVDRHMQEHSKSQRGYRAARRNFGKISMRIEDRIIDVFSRHLFTRNYDICSLMQVKLSMRYPWNKLRSFAWHNNRRGNIKEKTIAAFDDLRPVVEWVNSCFGSILNIRLARCDMGNLAQFNHLVMNCLHLRKP